MRIFFLVIFLVLTSSCADNRCVIYYPENTKDIMASGKNDNVAAYIGLEQISSSTTYLQIEEAIKKATSSIIVTEQVCRDSTSIFFDMYLKGHENLKQRSFFTLSNGKYSGGPFLIVDTVENAEPIVIQADRIEKGVKE